MTGRQVIRKVLDMGGLEDVASPHELFQHVAAQCAGHEEFRRLLDTCRPEQRRRAYDTLVPHLRFVAKPLDVYIAENQNEAERKQLPTIAADGMLVPFRRAEILSDEFAAQEAIRKSLARLRMTVVCRKCTKQAEFFGDRKADCIAEARSAGWAYDETMATGGETCPECLDFKN